LLDIAWEISLWTPGFLGAAERYSLGQMPWMVSSLIKVSCYKGGYFSWLHLSLSDEGNGFSQSQNWPVGFDHNGEIVVWEEEEDDYWDGLPLDWALEGAFGKEALAIRDAMEEDFQWEKMLAR
jgi:hypothetical protein